MYFISFSCTKYFKMEGTDKSPQILYISIAVGAVVALAMIGLSIICTMKRKKKEANFAIDDVSEQDLSGIQK